MTELGDEYVRFLRAAFRVANRARQVGSLAVGCVIVDGSGSVVAEQGCSGRELLTDPTGHAPMLAIRNVVHRHEGPLSRFSLYSNVEPCVMCAGAVCLTSIGRVVFGLTGHEVRLLRANELDVRFLDLSCREVFARCSRTIEVVGPCLTDEALESFADSQTGPTGAP
jgi:tRNA(Arg) A34 adenosine deaminase TadA